MRQQLFILLFLLAIGCSTDDYIFAEEPTPPAPPVQETGGEEDDEGDDEETGIEVGRLNAVKKAYQMTDILFTPLNPIEANTRTYQEGITYSGLIYSSTKEIGTSVGSNISFHTFMTAIHNPRSKIYTEKINKPPYHGTNCRAYYGTVCSGLVSYALGVSYGSYDFPVSDVFVEVDHSIIDSIQIADVLWRSGHVALITDIVKDDSSHVTEVEICEAVQNGCRRYSVTSTKFISLMSNSFKSIYRYTELYKNEDYTPIPEFVAVLDETPVLFIYNDYLCADKGDKACYREDEDVTINIMHDYECLEVYKDDTPYQIIDGSSGLDVVLQNLPYGDYKARIATNGQYSDYTYWKVVKIELFPDHTNGRLYFTCANAVPKTVSFTTISGSRKNAPAELYSHKITDEERSYGYLVIPQEQTNSKFPYIHFSVSTEYGKIINKPLNWFEQ